MIKLRNVSKKYGESIVFDSFSLTVNDGDRILVAGASGCGKTTLLRLICSFERADGGSVDVGGAKIAVMFQEPRLLPHKNALDNVRAVAKKAEWSVCDKYFEKMGLSLADDGKKMPSELSGGMKQRVALARFFTFAELSGADTLILDEPFAALDAERGKELCALLSEFSDHKTLIVASHGEHDAEILGAKTVKL